MKHCTDCKVDFNTNRKTCPLCFKPLVENKKNKTFTDYPSFDNNNVDKNYFYRIMFFVMVNLAISSIFINIFTFMETNKLWFIAVISGLLFIWSFVFLVFSSKRNVSTKILVIITLLSVFIFLIDITFTKQVKQFWSLTYVLPILFVSGLISLLIIIFVRPKVFTDYFMNIIIFIILSAFPYVLSLINPKLITNIWPSLTSFTFGLSTLIGLFILPEKKTKEELKKRLHL